MRTDRGEKGRRGRLLQRGVFRWILLLFVAVPVFWCPLESTRRDIYSHLIRHASAQTQPDFTLLEEAWKTIQRVYVDRSAINPHDLTYGALSGMVEALGDTGHSTFLSPEMLKMQRNTTLGKFEGIGAEIQMKAGQLIIVAPLDDSPAQRAGLRAGDIILKVDGQNITGLPLVKAVGKILGPSGTKVTLAVLSASGGVSRDVTIVRASVTPHNVTWYALPGSNMAFLRIAIFSKGVTGDLKKSLTEISKERLRGVVMDLRNNPGGLLDEAVGVASEFLKGGNVLLEKNASGKVTAIPVHGSALMPDLPLVVLVNAGSASAAEIVAGALQDAGRAKLVGQTTFGTGTVLEEFPLSDGSALLLAVREWLTPAGHTIWHRGITPDVIVSLAPNASFLTPAGLHGLTKKKLSESGDTQFLRALDILKKEIAGPQ